MRLRRVTGAEASLALAVSWVCVLTFAAVRPVRTQSQMTTAERIDGTRWWPTKATLPRADYVGAAACARCHQAKAESQARTAMARTATRAADSDVLRSRRSLAMKSDGYAHEIRTDGGSSVYTVSDGKRAASAALAWALGAGKVGQTFIFERNSTMHESRASYFGTLDGLDVTPGRARNRPQTLDDALGRPLSANESRRCFGCHTTALTQGRSPFADMMPGVTCEACHGPGRAHVEAMDQDRERDGLAALANLSAFSPGDSVDLCGACHATYWDVTLAGDKGISALRSQPYRLQSSRCWGEGDRGITCVACHNPHEPLERDARAYDARCLACHRNADDPANSSEAARTSSARPPRAPACRARQRHQCATCHMPKYQVPEMHFSFTDHLIRVVR